MTPLLPILAAVCAAVSPSSDRITAGEMAALVPVFAALPASTPLVPAPAPGISRRFTVGELRRLAARYHLEGEITQSPCWERPVAKLERARLAGTLHQEFGEGEIEIDDYSHLPVPEGTLHFPKAALRPGNGSAFWPGWVEYGGGHRFTVWARVRLRSTTPRVVAVNTLAQGKLITASDVRLELGTTFSGEGSLAHSLEEVVGHTVRRPVGQGHAIEAAWLTEPKLIVRGEPVQVEVYEGAAHLKLEARAETPGSAGEKILLVNPVSQRRFVAVVSGPGRAVVGKESK
jgi:flagellar basal body P-ring formation protein FlgA